MKVINRIEMLSMIVDMSNTDGPLTKAGSFDFLGDHVDGVRKEMGLIFAKVQVVDKPYR